MRRYTKDKMLDMITELTKELNRKPKILELAEFANRSLNRNDFINYAEYMEHYIGDVLMKYYINLYDLNNLVSTKTRTNKTKESESISDNIQYKGDLFSM